MSVQLLFPMKMTKCVQLVMVVLFLFEAQCDQWPEWAYKCFRNGCQRAEMNTFKNTSMYHKSLSVCRTVCGPFGGLWPKPTTAELGKKTIKIHPNNVKYNVKNVPEPVQQLLLSMTQVARNNLIAECRGNVIEEVDAIVTVFIDVKSDSDKLTWETKEQYQLNVHTDKTRIGVIINAFSVYGARHALETFVQLVAPDLTNTKYGAVNNTCSLNLVMNATITDKPVYPHRGFLLDTSRTFFPIDDIKRMIDAMASTKMNVFHWHVSDSHSFSLESYRVPQLAKYGAYSDSETYSLKEVKELVKYAQISGVRIVIEIDSPGHAGNGWQWGKRYDLGDLAVCVNKTPWLQYCKEPPCGQLNPANKNVYIVLDQLYRDIADVLLQPPLLHIGGDEVVFNCWNKSKQITKYMKSKGYKAKTKEGFFQLWSEFNKKVLKVWDKGLKNLGIKPQPVMIWSSDLTKSQNIKKYLDPSRYVIEIWGDMLDVKSKQPYTKQLINLKYRVVSAPNDWYLDHGIWGGTRFHDWKTMYSQTLSNHSSMLGGEVLMWSEQVNSMDLDSKVWPRAAAVAERLWSNPTTKPEAALPRLQRMRERLVNRGVRAGVISPRWCTQNDFHCK